jgi:DNA-binding NarL/FixJ family response regulator
MRYRVLVVEDQRNRSVFDEAFAADRARRPDGEAYLELAGLAQTFTDAMQHLEEELPDAIVIDDFLPVRGGTESRALALMSELCERGVRDAIPLHKRPRPVLWSTCEDNFAYTFCALGGLQYQNKKGLRGEHVPVGAIWRALAGQRWAPRPYPEPSTLSPTFRDALPWLATGMQNGEIAAMLQASEATIRDFTRKVRAMPLTPPAYDPDTPQNRQQAIMWVRRHGWVWSDVEHHHYFPTEAPFDKVIDPTAFAKPLPPAGPLVASVVCDLERDVP